jgi:hypothetical protein
MNTRVWSTALVLAAVFSNFAAAQNVTGSISGSVVDDTGAVVPTAAVTLVNERTGENRKVISSEVGDFVITALQPDSYTIKIEKQGFRALERTGIIVTATQRTSLGNLSLSIGQLTETVTVTQQGELVNTASAQHAALLSSNQVDVTLARGRDVINILKILPGVSQLMGSSGGASEVAEANPITGNTSYGAWGSLTPNISGTRSWLNNALLDGESGNDTGWVGSYQSPLPTDAIAEVKVVLNNYQAEYGRNGGGTINIISKGGTKDFHGNLYWYQRHEKLNANDFFNNRSGIARPVYRYASFGGTVGGPIYIPGKFNSNKDKLFFFYTHEEWRIRQPDQLVRYTLPTQLERGGNFSQTVDQDGRLVPVNDPLNGAPFPGNVIPSSRISPHGQVLLNMLPQPNQLDRSITRGAYNYEFLDSFEIPKRIQQLTIDYNVTDKDRLRIRPRRWWSDTRGYAIGVAGIGGVPLLKERGHYLWTTSQVNIAYTRILTPRVVNEFTAGIRGIKEITEPRTPTTFDPITRSKVGFTFGQLYPASNPLGLMPETNYGGIPSAPFNSLDGRTPQRGSDERLSVVENLSWIKSTHNFKFGAYIERNWSSEGRRSSPSGSFAGRFDFSRDPNNSFDANWPFATAMLGNYRSYVESTSVSRDLWAQTLVEWYAQDTWKVTRRLTIDYGLRFSWFTPWYSWDEGVSAAFSFGRYDPKKAPVFYTPVRNAGGQRVARNPITGDLAPAVFIGAFVPGSGDPANGMVLHNDSTYPRGFIENEPVQLQPRFGFAYDVFGDGKMAIRGGFGINKQTIPGTSTYIWNTVTAPPIQYSPQIFYGAMDTLLQSSGVLFPSAVTGLDANTKTPAIYNYSLGIQRDIGFNTVIDIAYVGNMGRHLLQTRDVNTLPYGTRFQPENGDPTNPGRALPDNMLRPYPGYGGITYIENSGFSNYNSLQFSANRRFTQGLQFGVAYTWSKSMDISSAEWGLVSIYRPYRTWLYGKSNYDQTHMLVVNYTWELPQVSRHWSNAFSRHVLDKWLFSGITSFASGQPRGISLSTTDNADITGGGDGVRVNVIQTAPLPHADRTFDRWFNVNAFARPPQGYYGNAPRDVFRGPGLNNWDLTLMKNFPLRSEQRYIQFRCELYNAFNHSQYQAVDNVARFDPQGVQVNGRFGQVTATRPPRVIQMALKLYF